MRPKSTAFLAALALLCAVSAAQSANATRNEQAMSNANVSLTQAIKMAEQQGGGQAISAEYEPKGGTAGQYEIKVLSNDGKKLTKYMLDPNTGKVTEVENEPFEKVFTRIKPNSIQNAPTSLTRAITTAERRAGGKATDASVDRDGDQVKYTVKVAKADGTTEKVKVNGSDGKVASAK
jgi:uncharacterized membrane protein YkoI